MNNIPPMPGLEFPDIKETIVSHRSAIRIIRWGQCGWETAEALRKERDDLAAEVLALRGTIARMQARQEMRSEL